LSLKGSVRIQNSALPMQTNKDKLFHCTAFGLHNFMVGCELAQACT